MKRKTGPKRDPLSLNCRLEAYFERNPSEWLTMEDMIVKVRGRPRPDTGMRCDEAQARRPAGS